MTGTRNLTYKQIISVWLDEVAPIANALNIDPYAVLAVIKQESNGNHLAIGATNDFGLMQITKPALTDYNLSTGNNVTINAVLLSPITNIKVGAWYLSWLKTKFFSGDLTLAFQAYNAGIGNVRKNKQSGAEYAESVNNHYQELRKLI